MSDYDHRFGGIARLYGKAGAEHFQRAHVCIIGIGGVGSWAVEALARSAIGKLTLVDLDDICVTNVNRQIHALQDTVGQPKVDAMAARILKINPGCQVIPKHLFLTAATIDEIFEGAFDLVIDAIDNVTNKCLLIDTCSRAGIPVITSGGAGGRTDPTSIRIDDLSRSTHDKLLLKVRQRLRREYGYPKNPKRKFRIPCVYSPEPVIMPEQEETACIGNDSPTGERKNLRLDCESGYGTTTAVTAGFGFAAAAWALTFLKNQPRNNP